MRIGLDLARHCIKTELKRVHNRAVADYFSRPAEREQLEPVIEITGHCLAVLDFSRLRGRHPALAGGSDCRVELIEESGHIFLTVDGERVVSAGRLSSTR